jgi:hypothetical protein
VVDDARKALHDMQLALDALQRGRSDEAIRYLQDVQQLAARMERHLKNPPASHGKDAKVSE